jgi:hypothetical protein
MRIDKDYDVCLNIDTNNLVFTYRPGKIQEYFDFKIYPNEVTFFKRMAKF